MKCLLLTFSMKNEFSNRHLTSCLGWTNVTTFVINFFNDEIGPILDKVFYKEKYARQRIVFTGMPFCCSVYFQKI